MASLVASVADASVRTIALRDGAVTVKAALKSPSRPSSPSDDAEDPPSLSESAALRSRWILLPVPVTPPPRPRRKWPTASTSASAATSAPSSRHVAMSAVEPRVPA